jgi:hypothetical protein
VRARVCVYVCVCACACERARTRIWVRACVFFRASACVCGCTREGVCLRACRLTYPVYHAQAPYFLRPLRFHHIFRHYVMNGTIFGKKSLNIKSVPWFSLQILFETFLILKRNQRDIVVNVKTSSCKLLVVFVGF